MIARAAALLLLLATPAAAQEAPQGVQVAGVVILNPQSVSFDSPSHDTALLANYQAIAIIADTADPTADPAVVTGPLIPKNTVRLVPASTPQRYELSIAQLGLPLPACLGPQSLCPTYRLMLIAVTPAGVGTARSNPTQPIAVQALPPPSCNVGERVGTAIVAGRDLRDASKITIRLFGCIR